LSSFYLDVLKDRLYCSGKKSLLRRSAQTALFELIRTNLILIAPILPFTTEEAWNIMPGFKVKEESVHLELFPSLGEKWIESEIFKEIENLVLIREKVLKELELARENKVIGNSLEASVVLKVPAEQEALLKKYESLLPSMFIVSEVILHALSHPELKAVVSKAPGKKCIRCWNFSAYVGQSPSYPQFCKRCEEVVSHIES
jgi:isoleucyl-tRNA synthetase